MAPGSKYLKWLYLLQVIPTFSFGPFGLLIGIGIFYLLNSYTQSSLKKALILALLPIATFIFIFGYSVISNSGNNNKPLDAFSLFFVPLFILMFIANIIGYFFLWRHYSALKKISLTMPPTPAPPPVK